jgi:hypothetical protein
MDNKIDELEYLMNPVMYHKWTTNTETKDKSTYTNDLKFYKKRIIQLTKDMLKGESVSNPLDKAFKDYTRSCIAYLKSLDRKDILQEDYKELELPEDDHDTSILDIDPNEDIINPEYKNSKAVISDFFDIKRIPTKKPEEFKFPNKKDLELKTPELKVKGVKKKVKKKKKKAKNTVVQTSENK